RRALDRAGGGGGAGSDLWAGAARGDRAAVLRPARRSTGAGLPGHAGDVFGRVWAGADRAAAGDRAGRVAAAGAGRGRVLALYRAGAGDRAVEQPGAGMGLAAVLHARAGG